MRKRTSLILAVALLSSLLTFVPANASHTDAFTFFIPWRYDDLQAFFEGGNQVRNNAGDPFIATGIEYIISISVLHGGGVIYYDHWEDGLEANLNFPVQASTEVWGDGLLSNGAPPGVSSDADDVLTDRQVIALRNVVPLPPPAPDVFYDGGDRLTSVGSAVAVTLVAWPQPGEILFADAFELYPTSRWGTEYLVPIGQDASRPNRQPWAFPRLEFGFGFSIVALNVQALDDGTTVDVINGDGSTLMSGTLNAGERLNVSEGVLAGARVTASAPVQVHVFAKDPISTYQARGYTLLPLDQWSNQYLAPRSSDGDFWIYNDNAGPIDVAIQAAGGGPPTTVTVPGGSAVGYPASADPVLANPSGVHFSSGDNFYVVAALDENMTQDWGYAVLPVSAMSTQALVGWAPANNLPDPCSAPTQEGVEASRIYVTALEATTIFVDFEPGRTTPFPVTPLQELNITDPDDCDMTGATLYTTDGVRFVAVWGQDASAPEADPSMDVGASIVPLRAPSIQKSYSVLAEAFNCGTLTQGNRVRFQLQVFNDSAVAISNVNVSDTLQPGITYRNNSTFIGSDPIPDSGSTAFPLDEGGYTIASLPASESVTITYEADIAEAGVFPNVASATDAEPASIEVDMPFRQAGYQVSKTLVDPASGPADPGQAITFSLRITNTGTVAITELPLRDEFNPAFLTFQGASFTPDITSTGVLTWTDLIPELSPGGLPPNSPALVLTLNFTVNNPLPSLDDTINRILSEGVQGEDGVRQALLCDEAVVPFATATSTSTPTSTPTQTSTPTATRTTTTTRPSERERTSTPRPTTPPPPPPAPAVTPTPVVQFLPETGVAGSPAFPVGLVLALPVLGLALLLALRRREE